MASANCSPSVAVASFSASAPTVSPSVARVLIDPGKRRGAQHSTPILRAVQPLARAEEGLRVAPAPGAATETRAATHCMSAVWRAAVVNRRWSRDDGEAEEG